MFQIGNKEYTAEELAALSKAGVLQIGEKNDPASTTLTATPLHGPFHNSTTQFGPFSAPGGRPGMFSALTRPNSWLSIVNVNRSEYTNELIDIQTGQTADGTSNATGFCGNPPAPGQLKVSRQQYTWGSFYGKTQLNALALIGQRRDRGDVSRDIFNSAMVNNPFIPDIMRNLNDTRSQLSNELYTFGVGMERSTELVSISGTAGSDNSRFGWFAEFKGLDGLIKTGHTDVTTGIASAALDSIVVAFNATITASPASAGSRSITEVLADTMYALNDRARQVGMGGGVQWAFVMRQEVFRRLVEVQANKYQFLRMSGAQYGEINDVASDLQSLRLAMLNGQYLLIEGVQYPVVFSEGMQFAATASNVYNTDIFVVPVSWAGVPLLRLEYFAMDNQYTNEFASFVGADDVRTINNGMMLVGKRSTGLCVEYHFQSRMRLILETPWLAARIDDVQFSYSDPTRTALPGTSLYVNGGLTYRT